MLIFELVNTEIKANGNFLKLREGAGDRHHRLTERGEAVQLNHLPSFVPHSSSGLVHSYSFCCNLLYFSSLSSRPPVHSRSALFFVVN